MPNWCINDVFFKASDENLQALKELFCKMKTKQKQDLCGQLPPFIEAEAGYFFDIDFEDEDRLHYQTRWKPNIEILQQIADKYNADFFYSYEESGNCIYGEATYENKILTNIFLEWEDFAKYQYCEDEDKYLFEGKLYDSDFEILETMLERRKDLFLNN